MLKSIHNNFFIHLFFYINIIYSFLWFTLDRIAGLPITYIPYILLLLVSIFFSITFKKKRITYIKKSDLMIIFLFLYLTFQPLLILASGNFFYLNEFFKDYILITYYIMGYFCIVHILSSIHQKKEIIEKIIYFTMLICIIGTLRFFIIDNYLLESPPSYFFNIIPVMEYRFIEVLIFLFGFSFSINSYFSKKDRKSLAQAMFFLILMLYCGSRTGLLAIVVALSFNIFKEKQMNLTLFITVFFASILLIDSITSQVIVNRLERLSEISLFTQLNLDLAIEEDRDVRRILYIKGGIEMFLNDFWFGTGLGSFQEAFPTYLMAQVGVEEVARPHNMYVSIAATSGVFGVFFLFGWILVLIKGSFNKNSLIDKSLVTFGISILVLSSGYDLETSPIFWIFMAILVGLSRNRSLINNFVYLKKN